MTEKNGARAFTIVFEAYDRASAGIADFDQTEFDEIDELRRLSEQMSDEPLVYLTRT